MRSQPIIEKPVLTLQPYGHHYSTLSHEVNDGDIVICGVSANPENIQQVRQDLSDVLELVRPDHILVGREEGVVQRDADRAKTLKSLLTLNTLDRLIEANQGERVRSLLSKLYHTITSSIVRHKKAPLKKVLELINIFDEKKSAVSDLTREQIELTITLLETRGLPAQMGQEHVNDNKGKPAIHFLHKDRFTASEQDPNLLQNFHWLLKIANSEENDTERRIATIRKGEDSVLSMVNHSGSSDSGLQAPKNDGHKNDRFLLGENLKRIASGLLRSERLLVLTDPEHVLSYSDRDSFYETALHCYGQNGGVHRMFLGLKTSPEANVSQQ